MANVKISQLPAVGSVTGTDVVPVVATTTTSKLTIKDLANSLPQVTSSINALTASYLAGGVTVAQAVTASGTTIYSLNPGTSGFSTSYGIFLGLNAGQNASSAAGSTFLGNDAGKFATSAAQSNFIGYQAGLSATNAVYSQFIGGAAGANATNAQYSIFIGENAGTDATDANESNFIGRRAGNGANAANNSNFFGKEAGDSATDANNSNFLGELAGNGATDARQSNFIGTYAGYQATNASSSNFIGELAGQQATLAHRSNFIGTTAGYQADNASGSNFIGFQAGQQADNAFSANFIGYKAGYFATNAKHSNFIGTEAGAASSTYSNFIGYKAGYPVSSGPSSNNIIIGTNITLPDGTANSINLGGVIFATGSYSNVNSAVFAGAMTAARVGINKVSPVYTLDVSGNGNFTNGLNVTGSIRSNEIIQASYVLGTTYYPTVPFNYGGNTLPAFATQLRGGNTGGGTTATLGYTFYYQDTNIGHEIPRGDGNYPAGAIKFVRDQSNTFIGGIGFGAGEGRIPQFTIISDNYSLVDDSTNYTYADANGRSHVLTVSGSILSKNAVSLGTNLTDNHIISGSVKMVGGPLQVSGSLIVSGSTASGTAVTFENGHVILSQVLTSLNFVDDAAAAAGGVPVGGLYRNGNFIVMRLT